MLTATYCKKLPGYVLKQLPEITNDEESNEESSIFIFRDGGRNVGSAYISIEGYRMVKGFPRLEIFINTFEVCRSQYGKGYGRKMFEWIEQNMHAYKISLCHRTPYEDESNSLYFWEHMGFVKLNDCEQRMEKYIK